MSVAQSDTVYLIDASIYIFRYYFSLPDNWWSRESQPTAAVYGFGRWLLRFLKEVKPQFIACCFDESLTSCFRNDLYPGYKASRALPDESLAFQLAACKGLSAAYGLATFASPRFEADDLIATLAAKSRKRGLSVCVVSRDKDLSQIIRTPRDSLWDFPDGVPLDSAAIFAKYGVFPEQMADFLALVGDPSDDIPGVPGVGGKTAAALLAEFGGWPEIRRNYNRVAKCAVRGAAKLGDKLAAAEAQIELSLQLASVASDAPLGARFRVTRRPVDLPALDETIDELGLGAGFRTSVHSVFNEI
ncbi:5'-3' exonuclease [Teredinibacter turnerae]|uniref:5'-3' exonuclease n=1 Tax=Teredinibacter turnerae TaxID=2426 RepID=UPI0003744BDA|nr:5'-3' exonuclease H3TH domain-containing protein [Teredinibacter turnerae]